MNASKNSRESRLFCALVIGGAALTMACGAREPSRSVSPDAAANQAAATAEATTTAPEPDAVAHHDTEEGANGVECCWAQTTC